jgi:hypothetical protein
MTKDQLDIEDINFILSEVRRISMMSISEEQQHIKENRNAHDFLYFFRDPVSKNEYICGRQASWRLHKLAERHLDRQKEQRDDMDATDFAEELSSLVARRFLKEGREVNKREVQAMLAAGIKRLKSDHKALTHFIPCAVFEVFPEDERLSYKQVAKKYKDFEIGPVKFLRTEYFVRTHRAAIRRSLNQQLQHSDADTDHTNFMMRSLSSFFRSYRWVAVISIPTCSERVSQLRAETAVQGAIDIIKLAFGPAQTDTLRMAESNVRPADIARLTQESDGRFNLSVSRTVDDGIGITDGAFDQIANAKDFYLDAAGSALTACVDPRKEIHLSRRFLDALTWYGQAVTESRPSSKIIKYVAAWERLTITQKEESGSLTDKVTSRIAILSHIKANGEFSNTLKDVKTIYDWRSKLMHGSCSPFSKELAGISSRAGNLSVTALNRSLEVFVPLAHRIKHAKEIDLENEYKRMESLIIRN